MRKEKSIRELLNDRMREAGYENPDEVDPSIRFEEGLRLLLKVPMVGPKGGKRP